MFLVRAVLNILVRNGSPRGPMCFRCLIFSLHDLVSYYFCCFFLLDLRSGKCTVVSKDLFVLCVACLTVFVN